MKRCFICFFILLNSALIGQNYKLFNSNSKKIFVDSTSFSRAYNISFDSVFANGTDSIYQNFKLIDYTNPITSSTCTFWGSQDCFPQNTPSWVGSKIIYNNLFNYKFITLPDDTLQFSFNTNTNDTIIFYQNTSNKFYLFFDRSDTISIFGNIDSVRFYKIIHKDNLGNIINSPLNQKEITVCKNWGLSTFFTIDSFPNVLKPIKLIGNLSPNGGINKITNELIYDYQIADEIQFHEYLSDYSYPPGDYNRYKKYTVLNKFVSIDSIKYTIQKKIFNISSSIETTDTINLSYYRFSEITNFPFETINTEEKTLSYKNYCSLNLLTFKSNYVPGFAFCPNENCWGNIDTNGPPPYESTTYVAGLGIYDYSYSHNLFPMGGYRTINHTINYFKKNGVACGSEAIVGITEKGSFYNQLNLSPNPAAKSVNVTFELNYNSKNVTIEVFNSVGQLLIEEKKDELKYGSHNVELNLDNIKSGIYFVKVITDNYYSCKKLIVN